MSRRRRFIGAAAAAATLCFPLAALAQRSMQLQATVQEGTLMLGDQVRHVDVEPLRWK